MSFYKILAADTKHYKSLIKDYRKDFNIITYGDTLTELEDLEEKDIIVIYNGAKISNTERKLLF